AFPRTTSAPWKASRFDHSHRKLLLKPAFNLLPKPSQKFQFLGNGYLRVFAYHDAGEIWNISSQGVNVSVPFDQNLDIKFHQAYEASKPLAAVHVGIGCCEIAPHESVTCQQNLLLSVVERDVVVAVAGRGNYFQRAGLRSVLVAEQFIRRSSVWRLP